MEPGGRTKKDVTRRSDMCALRSMEDTRGSRYIAEERGSYSRHMEIESTTYGNISRGIHTWKVACTYEVCELWDSFPQRNGSRSCGLCKFFFLIFLFYPPTRFLRSNFKLIANNPLQTSDENHCALTVSRATNTRRCNIFIDPYLKQKKRQFVKEAYLIVFKWIYQFFKSFPNGMFSQFILVAMILQIYK